MLTNSGKNKYQVEQISKNKNDKFRRETELCWKKNILRSYNIRLKNPTH